MAFIDSIKKTMAEAIAELEKKTAETQKQASVIASDMHAKAAEVAMSAMKTTGELSTKISESVGSAIKDGSEWASDVWTNKVPSKEELEEWASGATDKIKAMADEFDAQKMWEKISASASKAGQELVVMVLTMYYTIVESIQGKK
ncbi:MAG: hypothetical protein K2K97_01460 [Muribaculaceae bacterium]|nr:hypothetical protein [Muribaculaceae bacterium]